MLNMCPHTNSLVDVVQAWMRRQQMKRAQVRKERDRDREQSAVCRCAHFSDSESD